MGELTKILKEFDIRFADADDDEDRSEFSFGGDMDDNDMEDGMGDDDRVIDFRGSKGDHDDMDYDDEDMEDDDMDYDDDREGMDDDDMGDDDTFAGERRVDITDKLRKMLGMDDENGEEGEEMNRDMPSLSDLDLDSDEEDEDGDEEEFDFDVFNRRGTE